MTFWFGPSGFGFRISSGFWVEGCFRGITTPLQALDRSPYRISMRDDGWMSRGRKQTLGDKQKVLDL